MSSFYVAPKDNPPVVVISDQEIGHIKLYQAKQVKVVKIPFHQHPNILSTTKQVILPLIRTILATKIVVAMMSTKRSSNTFTLL